MFKCKVYKSFNHFTQVKKISIKIVSKKALTLGGLDWTTFWLLKEEIKKLKIQIGLMTFLEN